MAPTASEHSHTTPSQHLAPTAKSDGEGDVPSKDPAKDRKRAQNASAQRRRRE